MICVVIPSYNNNSMTDNCGGVLDFNIKQKVVDG